MDENEYIVMREIREQMDTILTKMGEMNSRIRFNAHSQQYGRELEYGWDTVIKQGKEIWELSLQLSKDLNNEAHKLTRLVNSRNTTIRQAIAENGYALDKYVNDKAWEVRKAVAWSKQEKYLDILVNDKNENVRELVALCGTEKHWAKLFDDEYEWVRYYVAKRVKRKQLAKYINDESEFVRGAVAKRGYGLDILINDNSPCVREIAQEAKRQQDRDKSSKKES